jgi:septal ring factor EnvC (AmiA/AmiB activator)
MRLVGMTIVLALALFCGSGCVAYQIRDELRVTNSKLDKVSAQLAQVDASLAETNQKLNKSNHSLSVVEGSMDPIRVSLRRIDDELAGFREMLDKLDRYLPVNLKADTPQPVKQAPTTETTPQPPVRK